MTIVLAGMFGTINAQNKSGLSNEALSAQYKHEIDILNSQIKAIKIQLKADKQNNTLKIDLAEKQAQLKDIKARKKVIDNAIKSQKSADKAVAKAERARKKAEQHASDAQRLRDREKDNEKENK